METILDLLHQYPGQNIYFTANADGTLSAGTRTGEEWGTIIAPVSNFTRELHNILEQGHTLTLAILEPGEPHGENTLVVSYEIIDDTTTDGKGVSEAINPNQPESDILLHLQRIKYNTQNWEAPACR